MIALIDIGNTLLKWGTFLKGSFQFGGAVDYKQHAIATALSTICSGYKIDRLLIANVGPANLQDEIQEWQAKEKRVLDISFIQSEKEHSCGLINAYTESKKLGVDRWLSMIACWQAYRSAFCLVACGTAITVDVVDQTGHHLGGLIVPGIHLMQTSLKMGTARCNVTAPASLEDNFSLLAQETNQAIETGSIFTAVAFIERIVNELQEDYNGGLVNIITGGDASLLLSLLTNPFIHEQNTVLRGLAGGYTNIPSRPQ